MKRLAFVLSIVCIAACGSTSNTSASTSTDPSSFDLPALSGSGTVALASYRGKPVVVDLFATWCSACKDELPLLASASKQLRGKVTFIGVNSEETGNGLAMAQQYGIAWWPLAQDVDGANNSGLHDNYGVQGMPVAALYDATGHLVEVVPAAFTQATLAAQLKSDFGITLPS